MTYIILFIMSIVALLTFLFTGLTLIVTLLTLVSVLYFFLCLFFFVSHLCELMNSESRKWIDLFISIVFGFGLQMRTVFQKWIGFGLGTFFQMVLYSKSFFPFWYLLLAVMVSVGAIATIFFLRRIFFVLQKVKNNAKAELNMVEGLIVFFTAFGAMFPLGFVLQKMFSYSLHFLHKIFRQIVQNRTGAGLLCGFICTATMGYIPYLFLAPRLSLDNFEDSFFFEHHQKRVAVITSFFVGQCFKFLFFYNLTVYEALYKRNFLLLIFLAFFVFQVFWTHETIVKNWKYLYPNDKRKRVVKRILFVQLEFVANFFIQLAPTDSRVEKLNSMVRTISLRYIEDKVFVRMTFLGWFLGHIVLTIFYTNLFQLLRVWVYPYIKKIFDSKGGGGRNEDSWDFFM